MKTEKITEKNNKSHCARDPLGLALVMAGMCFLVNPTINIIDFIPDLIGLLMIAKGLSHMAVFTEHMKEAARLFSWLALVSAAKLAVCAALPYASDNFRVLMAFSFSVVEALLFIPAMNRMFEGFMYAGLRLGCDAVYGSRKKSGKRRSVTALRVLTVASFVVRAAGSVLPVTPVLMLYETRGYVGANTTDPAEFTEIYYVLAAIAALAVGIPWLCGMLRYIGGIRRDTEFCSRLENVYFSDFRSDGGKVAAARMKPAMIVGIIGAVLGFDMYFDQINILPDALSALFLAAATIMLMKYSSKAVCIGCVASSALWAAASCGVEVLSVRFSQNNYTSASVAHGIGQAQRLYTPIEILTLAETLFMLATLMLYLAALKKAVRSHIPLVSRLDSELYNSQDISSELEKSVSHGMLPLYVTAGIAVLTSALYPVLFQYAPAFWIVKGVASLVFAAALARQYVNLSETVYTRLEATV